MMLIGVCSILYIGFEQSEIRIPKIKFQYSAYLNTMSILDPYYIDSFVRAVNDISTSCSQIAVVSISLLCGYATI